MVKEPNSCDTVNPPTLAVQYRTSESPCADLRVQKKEKDEPRGKHGGHPFDSVTASVWHSPEVPQSVTDNFLKAFPAHVAVPRHPA